MVTLADIQKNEDIKALISAGNRYLAAMGFTEHGPRHVSYVSRTAAGILAALHFSPREVELAAIAGWVHDVGNSVNRHDHGPLGAVLLLPILRETGMAVANCHKELASDFDEEDLSSEQIVRRWLPLLAELRRLRPALRIAFTVSPYRYAKWGFHESRLQKARLLLATDALCRQMPEAATYFPAYEIVEDELRDYRFYAPDLIHLAPQTEEYIWQRVQQWAFSPQLSEYAADKARLLRLTAHRPLHADAASQASLNERKAKMEKEFEDKWRDLYI